MANNKKANLWILRLVCMGCIIISTVAYVEMKARIRKTFFLVRKLFPFIHALDSAIISSGVDEVCEKIYGRPEKK